jgi:tRNA(Met) cytidine acetyltransferase
MMSDSIAAQTLCIKQLAEKSGCRAFIWLRGTPDWQRSQLQCLAPHIRFQSLLISPIPLCESEYQVSCHQTHRFLGSELEWVIYDAYSGINPDSLGHVSGLLKGGGVFLFLSAESEQEFCNDPEKQRLTVEPLTTDAVGNHFLTHFLSVLQKDDSVYVATERLGWQTSGFIPPVQCDSRHLAIREQTAQCESLIEFLKSHQAAHAVVTAPRGRGKSYLLGMCAHELIESGFSVVVTAPNRPAIASILAQVSQAEPTELNNGMNRPAQSHPLFEYLLPTAVADYSGDAKILFVDEAAAIPVQLLIQYMYQFQQVVFATTTQGYEGTGQGFNLRFRKTLSALDLPLKEIELCQPIRWSDQDRLEPLFNRLLLLDASSATLPATLQAPIEYQEVTSQWLISHPHQLHALFGLMIDAHYRTSPGDLRIMLDSPNVSIWVAISSNEIVAGCILAAEGALDSALVENIWAGTRRPRGHLIPQLLVQQQGFVEAGSIRVKRVVRIAVHDQCRRQGIAEQLLSVIERHAIAEGFDGIGASFAMSAELLDFWQAIGYAVMRVGTQRDAHSGAHSALVLKPLNQPMIEKIELWQSSFFQHLPYLQKSWLKDVEPELMRRVESSKPNTQRLTEEDAWQSLKGFAYAYRTYESSAANFSWLAERYIELWSSRETPAIYQSLIAHQVIAQIPYDFKEDKWHFSSEKVLLKALREAGAYLIEKRTSFRS